MSHSKRYIDFAGVKAAVTMADALDHYDIRETFSEVGNADSLRGPCPIHGGDNPKQFSVSLAKNCWNCFSECQRGGNVLDFVALMEKVDVHSAALLLDEWFSLGLVKADPQRKMSAPPKAKRPARRAAPRKREPASATEAEPGQGADADEPDEPAATSEPEESETPSPNPPLGFSLKNLDAEHPYFAERGVSPEVVEEFGLGFCKKGTMAGRVVIPVHNRAGELVAYVGRWPGTPPEGTPKYKFPKGFKKSLELFNLHRAAAQDDDQPLVVVEGFFGCLRLWQLGYRRAVALMGCKISEAQRQAIGLALPRYGTVSLLFDRDPAGAEGAAHALAALVQDLHVRVVDLPEIDQPDGLTEDEMELPGFL